MAPDFESQFTDISFGEPATLIPRTEPWELATVDSVTTQEALDTFALAISGDLVSDDSVDVTLWLALRGADISVIDMRTIGDAE